MVSSSMGSFSVVTFDIPVEGIEPVFQLDIRINTATPGSSVYVRDLFIMSCHTPFTTTGKITVNEQDCTLAALYNLQLHHHLLLQLRRLSPQVQKFKIPGSPEKFKTLIA